MATYDPVEQRMTVRVVYDGVAFAGKTTNLRQLCTLFAAQRSSKVYSPADLNGRTLFFDWMQITAGLVCGFPLLCQIVSVPGQVVLTPRRRHLLASADVIVYVCESTEAAIPTARSGLALYDDLVRQRGGSAVPLVVQANKQDQLGALDGATLVRALGREGIPVVEGVASEGVGVVDTFVTAVRTVARALQARSEADALRVHVRRAETAAEVLSRVSEAHTDPEWAAEMLLEEASAVLQFEEARKAVQSDAAQRAAAAAAALDLTRIEPCPREVPVLAPGTKGPRPPPPSADVPTGFIWPAHTGRATLRSLAMLHTEVGDFDADGGLLHAAHGHVARTSMRSRFPDGETARQALVRRAREYTQLDRLLVPETVLVAQAGPHGCWIWSVRPDVPTVARLVRERTVNPDLIGSYGAAVVEVLRASLRHGFTADFSPEAFGVQQGLLRYTGELTSEAPTAARLSAAMFAAIDALAAGGVEVGSFLDAFEHALQRRLTAEERTRALGVLGSAPGPNDPVARDARRRLHAVLARATEMS